MINKTGKTTELELQPVKQNVPEQTNTAFIAMGPQTELNNLIKTFGTDKPYGENILWAIYYS